MKPALLSVMRRLGLLVVPAVLMFGASLSPAQAQSWHYQNCIKNTCVPSYWSCRGVNTYAYCNTGYKSCQGVCWTSHRMGAAARGPLRGNVRGDFYPSAPSYRSNRGYSYGGSYGSSRSGYGSSGYRSGNYGSSGRSGYGGSSYGGGSYRRY